MNIITIRRDSDGHISWPGAPDPVYPPPCRWGSQTSRLESSRATTPRPAWREWTQRGVMGIGPLVWSADVAPHELSRWLQEQREFLLRVCGTSEPDGVAWIDSALASLEASQ